jgi:hypothetical protein
MPSEYTDLTRGIYRRIYSGFLHGKRINSVSIEAEAWFWRVHSLADDFGNFRADPEVLRAEASPKRRVSAAKVAGWMQELASARLVTPYAVDGDPFAHIEGFVELQPASSKNGKRTQRCPAGQGESRESKDSPENPIPSSPHHHQHHHQNQHHSDHQHQHHAQAAAGGGGDSALTPEGERAAQALSKAPDWLKDGQGWFDLAAARGLVALALPPSTYATAIRSAKTRRANLKNPAGFIRSELHKAAAVFNGSGSAAPPTP